MSRQALELSEKNVPKGWVLSRVDQFYSVVGGGTPSTKIDKYWKGNIPWITSADIHGLRDIKPRKKITSDAIKNSATNLIPAKSIIVVTRVGLGKVAQTKIPLCISQDSQALIPATLYTDQDYVLYYLSRAAMLFKHAGRGTTISGVTKRQLSHLRLPLPPLLEQKRIASKIESIFAKIDKAETLLKDVHARNKQLRQVVLKRAFEGKLVPQDPDDTPVELVGSHTERNLPKDWVIATLGQVATLSKEKAEPKKINDRRYIGLEHIESNTGVVTGYGDSGDVQSTKNVFNEGDVLYGRLRPYLNKACIPNFNGICSTDILVLRTREFMMPLFFCLYLRTMNFVQFATARSHGVNLPRVRFSTIENYQIPLPPYNEQKRIVSKIETVFARIDTIDERITKLLSAFVILRKSVLKRAFEGRLVPQDPNDEHTCKMLERVRGT